MIEQPGANTVTNLAAAALLIERARRIESEVIEIDLAVFIDKRQWNRTIGSPKRLL
jgi:hypothetical protein